jgi:hypothetical protein
VSPNEQHTASGRDENHHIDATSAGRFRTIVVEARQPAMAKRDKLASRAFE